MNWKEFFGAYEKQSVIGVAVRLVRKTKWKANFCLRKK